MNSIGRNDPCPCGSGKKYKRCCGLAAGTDRYRAVRMLEARAEEALSALFFATYPREALDEAWRELLLEDELELDPEDPMYHVFGPWLLYDWKGDDGEPIARTYLKRPPTPGDEALLQFIQSVADTPHSLFQVRSVIPGALLDLRDILRQRDIQVTDVTASKALEPGFILYGRVVEEPGLAYFVGTASAVLPPTQLQAVVALRLKLVNDLGAVDGVLTAEHLHLVEEFVRMTYLDLDEDLQQAPVIRNKEGDPFESHLITYDVESFETAFDALKSLQLSVMKGPESELYEVDGRGKRKGSEARIDWLKRVGSEAVVIASLHLKQRRLTVDVNSERRAKKVKKEIEKRLGASAVFLREVVSSMEDAMKKAAAKKQNQGSAPGVAEIRPEDTPEGKKIIAAFLARHWAEWPDHPLPALNGQTPRAAAKTKSGRELLEGLFWEFERGNRNAPAEQRVDVRALAKSMGLVFSPEQRSEGPPPV